LFKRQQEIASLRAEIASLQESFHSSLNSSKAEKTRLQAEVRSLQHELASFKTRRAEAATQERLLASIRAANYDYKKLTSSSSLLLFPKSYDALIQRIYSISFNPLAHRILNIPCDLIHQQTTPFQSDNKEEEKLLNEFWFDPINNMPVLSREIIYKYGLFGEQYFTVFTNLVNNRLRLGTIHPFQVEQTILDPDNDRVIIGVKLKKQNELTPESKADANIVTTLLSADHNEQDLFSPETQALRASFRVTDPITKQRQQRFCFVFQNNPQFFQGSKDWGISKRGIPDLTPLYDFILATDDILSSMVERADILSRTLWTLQVEGGTLEENDPLNLDRLKERFGTVPERWEVLVSNEKMKWDRQDAPIGNSDMVQLLNAVQLYILGGVGYPEVWFMGGRNSNRASSLTMEYPTLKKLENRQHTIYNIYETLLSYQVQQAHLTPSFKMVSTPIKDSTQKMLVDALLVLSEGLERAQSLQWVNSFEAATIYRSLIQDLGIKLQDVTEANFPEIPESSIDIHTSSASDGEPDDVEETPADKEA